MTAKPSHEPVRAPTLASDERIYAIGDIHGRYDLLIALLARIEEDAGRFDDRRRPRLVFLGDYIDRGPQSREVMAALTTLAEADSPDLVFLFGNHEVALRTFLAEPETGADWLGFGGRQTLESFGIPLRRDIFGRLDLRRIREELAQALRPFAPFLDRLRLHTRSGDVFFCHAAVDPARPLSEQSRSDLVWGRADGLVDIPVAGARIVHGHYDDVTPTVRPGRVCVDTGAYYSGILTAARLDNGLELLSVRGSPAS